MSGLPPVITREDLRHSPAWFPLGVLDAADQSVTLLKLDEPAYRAASFLDERLLQFPHEKAVCSAEVIVAAAEGLPPPPHYVFHIGHVGSTLLSRLIGEHADFFSLREPKMLREFAQTAADAVQAHAPSANQPMLRLDTVLALLARTWNPQQRPVIKATSFVSELAQAVLGAPARPTALFMFADAVNYLRGILGGANSRLEAHAMAATRRRRLERRLAPHPSAAGVDAALPVTRSEGEVSAMNWLCEMSTLHQAALRFPRQVLWMDFDAFLQAPAAGLDAALRAFGAAAPAAQIESIVTGPLMQTYSKAPEYAYDAALRREVLRAADVEHAAEIRRGIEWLHAAGRRYPSMAEVLNARRA